MTGDQQTACVIIGIIAIAVVLIVLIVSAGEALQDYFLFGKSKDKNKDKKPLI